MQILFNADIIYEGRVLEKDAERGGFILPEGTKVIVVCNNKGGVGKSTSVAAMGDILARELRKRVLLIDGDPQGNLSKRFGFSSYDDCQNSYEILLKLRLDARRGGAAPLPVNDFANSGKLYEGGKKVRPYETLRIFCATRDLEKVYSEYRADPEFSDCLIRDILQEVRESGQYDYVLIDTQPVLSYILGQYMLGSDYVLIPVTPNDDAFDGALAIGDVYMNTKQKKERFKDDDKVELLGYFFNQVKKSTLAQKHFLPKMNEEWGENPKLETMIPYNQEVNNAEIENAPISSKNPNCPASVGFRELVREVVSRIG